jgi:hypothetical protein
VASPKNPDGVWASGPGAGELVVDGEKPPGFGGPAEGPSTGLEVGPRRGVGARVRLTRIRGVSARGVLGRPLYLPATLNELTLEETAEFTEFTTHARGEFAVPQQGGARARSLRTLPIDMLTLDWEAPWLVEWRQPRVVQRELEDVLCAKKPVHMLVMVWVRDGSPVEFRGDVTLRRTVRTLKPGEADTRYWTLEWRDHRALTSARLATKAGKGGVELPARHRLKATTTLAGLSKRYYGTTAHWQLIAKHNGIEKWGPRTPIVKHHRFKVNDIIKIPELTRHGHKDPARPASSVEAI